MTPDEARQLIADIRRTRAETEGIEVKTAQGGTPFRPLRETMSAFANSTGGGVIVLGIDERLGFIPVGVHDAQKVMTDVVDVAKDSLTPPVQPVVTLVEIEGKAIVVVEIPELLQTLKPCFISSAGIQTGSFVRIGPSNRQMTTYEVFELLSFRERRASDRDAIKDASIDRLDRRRIDNYVLDLQKKSRRTYSDLQFNEVLEQFGIAKEDGGGLVPTLAGLICFSDYPQQYRPQLRIVFDEYYGVIETERDPNGARYINDMEFDGPIDEMIDGAVAAIQRSLPTALYVDNVRHRRVPLIPRDAVREAIVNAVAHRDYSGFMTGSAIQVRLFADRLEIRSPGGLFGGLRIDGIQDQQATRNEQLMRFMQDLGLVENRGHGIDEMTRLCLEAGLPAPEFAVKNSWFEVTFRKHAALDRLARRLEDRGTQIYDTRPARETEIVLDLIDRIGRVTNADLREQLGLERWQATRLLQRLAAKGIITKHGDRRGVYYTRA